MIIAYYSSFDNRQYFFKMLLVTITGNISYNPDLSISVDNSIEKITGLKKTMSGNKFKLKLT